MQNNSITAVDNIFVCNVNIGTFRWQQCGRLFNAWCALGIKNGPILETDLLGVCGYYVSAHVSFGCPSCDKSWLVDLQSITVWNRALLEELRGHQLVKKFLAFYGEKSDLYHVQKGLLLVPVLSQMNAMHVLSSCHIDIYVVFIRYYLV
jgi:hypothetical protein